MLKKTGKKQREKCIRRHGTTIRNSLTYFDLRAVSDVEIFVVVVVLVELRTKEIQNSLCVSVYNMICVQLRVFLFK